MNNKEISAGVKSVASINSFEIDKLTPEQVAVIKSTVAKGATDVELKWFLYQANALGLNPLTKEIWFIKRVKKEKNALGRWDYPRLANGQIDYSKGELVIMTSKDGYFKKATDNPEFVSVQSMEIRENDEFEMEFDGERMKVRNHLWKAKDRGKIISAWACVTYKDGSKDWNFVSFDEYCQQYEGKPLGVWANNPSAMIKKCAETPILKKAARLSGITTAEEMEHVIEGDSAVHDNNPEKVTVREEAILDILAKIQKCPDLTEFEKVKQEINLLAKGLLVEEVELIKKELIAKKKTLENTPAPERSGGIQVGQAVQTTIS
jgi:phage recombination protein Bet